MSVRPYFATLPYQNNFTEPSFLQVQALRGRGIPAFSGILAFAGL
jgi:hypothetical protein